MNKYHFIGIGGIGMSALAQVLLDEKQQISGSDLMASLQTEKLKNSGAHIYLGHHAKNIKADTTVVYSSAVKSDNPEYRQALSLNCKLLHRSELLAQIIKDKKACAVVGSHGKTTTSSLLSHVLMCAQMDPTCILGGHLQGSNAHKGRSLYVVFEADESDGTFENYEPSYAIVTNLDREHLEHYGSFEKLKESCLRFVDKVKEQVVYCKDDPNLNFSGISYGFHPDSDYQILDQKQIGFEQTLSLRDPKNNIHTLKLPLIGIHNALNGVAVFAMASVMGLSSEVITQALSTFPGVGRRMEKRGEDHQILRLDDYGHHPTEIKTTLQALKMAIGERRLVVLFQPHRYSRTQELMDDFAEAFDRADLVYITDIYPAGEMPIEGVVAETLVEKIKSKSSVSCRFLPHDQWTCLNDVLRPHDVFLSLGAGDVTHVHHGLSPKKKYKVGLIYGGRSCEHEISCRSFKFVRESLDKSLYDLETFFIDKTGLWHLEEESEGYSLLHSKITKKLEMCDLFFPILHGTYGEDGTIQGLFEMLGKPYVGPDCAACALGMNKMQSKQIAAAVGVLTPKAVTFTQKQWWQYPQQCLEKALNLTFPVFVKPMHLGSSVGISKVLTQDELVCAIDKALFVDTELLIEESVELAREIEFAVIGNHNGFQIHVPDPGEKLADGAFVTYDLKYSSQPVKTTVDVNLDPEILKRGKEQAQAVYQAVGCSGMTRVDFLLDKQGNWWFFELNSIPGMTALSLFPKIWKREGFESAQLMNWLIKLAIDKHLSRVRYFKPCLV